MTDGFSKYQEAHLKLLQLTAMLGESFGTEDFSQFLYALVRMQKPETIVELGTGLGVSAFWMALAAEMNGRGHVFSVDDLNLLRRNMNSLPAVISALEVAGFGGIQAASPEEYFREVIQALGVEQRLTVIERVVQLEEPQHFNDYPFANRPIDLLFSDFRQGPGEILLLLSHFLPRMATSSSIFIDSVPTTLSSSLVLDKVLGILNTGRIPEPLYTAWPPDCRAEITRRRFVVLHLVENKNRTQNSTTWVKIEPFNVGPSLDQLLLQEPQVE